MLLTKHEGETFQNQTVYISGQAFVRCTFAACTLVLRETVYYMEGCSFDRCNWHIDAVLPWGSPDTLNAVQVVMNLVRQGQENLPASPEGVVEGQPGPSGAGGEGSEGGGPPGSPFAS
jgi:hypothetical protein